jgi:hypothetical protein
VSRRRVGAALLLLLTGAGAGEAASFTLGEGQMQEAVELGERSVTRDSLGDEWRVRNAAGDVATVMTPFHRLALAARHAAFRKDPLSPRDRDRLLKGQHERLVFIVEMKGPREDFARFYAPRLVAGGRRLEPSFTQNEHTPARGDDGRFVARCIYTFPTKSLSATGKVVLVVRDGDGRDVSSFAVDLASMR